MKARNINFYQDLFAGAHDAIFVVDSPRGCVVEANAAAAKLLGYELEDFVGKFVLDLFLREDQQAAATLMAEIWDSRGTREVASELMTHDGDCLPVCLSAHMVSEHGQDYLAIFYKFIPDHVVNNNRLIANLSHELRTPLNALIGMSDLLTGMDLAEEPKEAVNIVADSANGLLGLVNDVLDYAKIEAGKMELNQEPFHFEGVLQGVADTFALQVKQKNLSYSLKLDRRIPKTLVGDEGRLRQILVNLVGNALKFTDEGGITVEVRLVTVDQERAQLEFSIIDTGCGITESDMPQLFEPFTQVGSVSDQQPGGTGLGLNISRNLVEKMGGSLDVSSQEGWGSNFSFTLPLDLEVVETRKSVTAVELEVVAKPLAARRVLLAEDNMVNQKVALGMMRKLGLNGVAVDNGRLAIELLADEDFDLVFMDLQMPELGGLEATRKIRSGKSGVRNKDIPIIAMTGHATRQDRAACLKAGMNGYVTKPISSERIGEAIADLAAPPGETAGTGRPFAMSSLVAQMNGDAELAAEILDIFCEDTSERLAKVEVAIQNYHFEVVREEAQAIEGGALNVCAEIMVDLCRELYRSAGNKEQEFSADLVTEMAAELAVMLQVS